MSKGKTPQIRFKGYTDDWEQRKLSNIADIVGGGTPSTSNPDYWDGDIDWYTPAEIGEQIFANGSVRKITKDGLNHSSAKILPADKTVLFTSRAGIGNMAILQRLAATNQGFQSLVCHDDIDPYFVFSMGDSIKTKAERVAAGSTFAEISGKKLGDLELMFPSTDEQKAIGNYFKNLDHLITLHQRQEKSTKYLLLRKEIITWEQRKFDEAFIERRDKTEKENEDILLSCAINGMFLNSELFGHFRGTTTIGYLRVKKNDLILSAQNLHLGNANVNLRFEHGIISPAYKVYDLNDCNPEFVQSWVKRDDTKKFFLAATTEGASQCRKNIEWETLGKQTISMPSLDEQKRVGSFFGQLDNLITLHQREEKLLKIL